MLRSPLMPWISASTSIAQSHVRQNGLCQRTATNAKFTRPTPSPTACMITTWPTARTSRTSPEMRMNSQAHSSKPPTGRSRPTPRSPPPRAGRGAGAGVRGSVAVATSALPDQVHDLAPHDVRDREHAREERCGGGDPEGSDVSHELRKEVDQHDLRAVQGVIDDRCDEPELEHAHERVLVDGDDAVVGLGSPPDHRGVHDVGEEEEDDRDARDPVEEP